MRRRWAARRSSGLEAAAKLAAALVRAPLGGAVERAGAGGAGSSFAAAGCFADGAFRGAVDAFRAVVAAFCAAALDSGAASGGALSVAPRGSA